jgi:4-amino-4-deoxy-L-arabinose transferase-like glycosyltransferase
MNSMGVTGEVPAAPPAGARRMLRWQSREDAAEERWARPALFALLALTAFAYTWNLSESGYANSFYAAAVQAGTESWKALFFGSLDSSSFITVDKPPAALWVMALSGRIFGFSSWSMLVPQALEGVAAVWLLYATVKRWFGAASGLAAGAILAMTPVAALMFRFNNPDALLVALLVASAYCITRALERGASRWVLAAGALIGFAFLAKMGQALLVVPGFALAYLIAAPVSLRRRLAQLLGGLAALVLSCGWWVAIVALLPASSRPFIDGSPDNNIFNLIFGYNGFSRIFGGGGPGGGGGGGGGVGFSGATGALRLFDGLMGSQASWLLPAALIALVAGIVLRRGAPRTDRTRAALIVWGGWLAVTAAIFSFSSGVIHTYYTVALAPAIAALVAIGGRQLWEQRASLWARVLAAAVVAGTGAWSYALLDRSPTWNPWLRTLVVAASVIGAGGLLLAPLLAGRGRPGAIAVALAVAIACLAGPVAYSAQTITTAHKGSIPSAGPAADDTSGFGGGGFPGVGGGPAGGGFPGSGAGAPAGSSASGAVGSLFGARGGHGRGSRSGGFASGVPAGGGFGPGASAGGLAGGVSVSSALVAALDADASHYRWVAATSGSMSAASLELATDGKPVMAIGGFNNNGGELTLAQFEAYVAKGEIHYYIAGGGGGGGVAGLFGVSSTSQIGTWVAAHFKSETVGGTTLYIL